MNVFTAILPACGEGCVQKICRRKGIGNIMEFMIGCNYWASNAGTEMWKNWDAAAVEKDLALLSSHGATYLRVFPNWRDFQPVMPMLQIGNVLVEYRLEGERFPENPYYLDEVMLERFSIFCDLCDKYNIKLIVGLLTGWMSGRLFIPSALYGKNLYTDPTALWLEQKFIKGFVERFRDRKCIFAWDLGNECNCLDIARERVVAANWSSVIANAIRSADNTRPVVSGMHSLDVDPVDKAWLIQDQAEYTDILTTHPYPMHCMHTDIDRYGSIRTLLHATAQTKYYANVGKKPCLAEEIGTMGPMPCSDECAEGFLRVNLYSNWAAGASGVMWWCANDQTNLTTAPYTWIMCEVELGMITTDFQPKPVLKEMKKFAEFLKGLDFTLPPAKEDAVCITSQKQDQWGISYMSYILGRQANLNLSFAYVDCGIPEADVYLLPSIHESRVMSGEQWKLLRKRVEDGATLYISMDDGIVSEFQTVTGMKPLDSEDVSGTGKVVFGGEEIVFSKARNNILAAAGAEVLAYDDQNNPAISKYRYGKGTVYFVNFPLERMLLTEHYGFDSNRYVVYKELLADCRKDHIADAENPYVSATQHFTENGGYCVFVNYSDQPQKINMQIKNGYTVDKVYCGNTEELEPFGAAVISFKK